MDDNNNFLNSYKRRLDDKDANDSTPQAPQAPAASPSAPASTKAPAAPAAPVHSLHYEQRSGFKQPQRRLTGRIPVKKKRPNYTTPIAAGAIAVVVIIVAVLLFVNRGTPLQDFTGWAEADAQLWASNAKVTLQETKQYNDKVDAGKIISQDPQKDAKVKKGDFIKVTVSLGHDLSVTLPLPDILNMTMADVQKWAADNFMTKVRITAEYSDSVPENAVISYEINDKTVVDNVRRDTPIYVVVSKGPEDQAATLITVPDFKAKTLAECYEFANDNGVTLEVVEQFDEYQPKGAILSQSVKANAQVRKGDKITLTVSKGKQITVPDFSDDTKEVAAAVASGLGITATVVEKYSSQPVGEFISQSIDAGTVYDGKGVLELDYSLGNKIVVASYVGQTLDAIQTWAVGLNAQGAGIVIKATYTQSDAAVGMIIYQSKKNTTIGVKTTISVTVSQGRNVFVPDFVAPSGSGYDLAITRDEAMKMCEDAGIVPVFVAASQSGRLPGEIWYQSVAAGKEVAQGATITLKYNPANVTVLVPDFTGMTEADITSGGYMMQFSIVFATGADPVAGYEGKVYKQSVRAGSTVAAGSVVTVTLGPT